MPAVTSVKARAAFEGIGNIPLLREISTPRPGGQVPHLPFHEDDQKTASEVPLLHGRQGGDAVFDSSQGTTNLFLGIMAAVSIVEALVLTAAAVAMWKAYGRSIDALAEARRQITPLVARVNEVTDKVDAIANDVKDVTGVARRTAHLYGLARGVRAAYHSFISHDASRGGRGKE